MEEDLDPTLAAAERKAQARRLIDTIAQEHTLNGAIFGTKFETLVNNCLEILSNQLYEKSTHFLLELIQNADDNVYTCPTPTLSFFYRPGCLRIDCNEVGFDAGNVAAICGISESTKSGKTADGEFIGEKGIGFKSVFKAADVVWIASNEFTFKFDRRRPLGVITPIWEGFPEGTSGSETSIFLQLAEVYDEETLIKELLGFDTNLLIFLRRVEEINIQVNRADEDIWKKQIRKTQYEQQSDRIVVLKAGYKTLKYLVRTHIVKDLPREIKRPDWTQTKILMAFPVPEDKEKPLLKSQNVYAFLPIRNYGFKFLIQADFLLTASREEIESTLPWNRRIRDALAEAFLLSMFHFNKGVLKYIWPYYLPSLSIAVSGFFEPAIQSIIKQLGEAPVFESCAGSMVKPSTLVHVPADFCADGEPFTLCDLTKDRYLSSNYASWVIESMTSVGVSELSPRQFLTDLSSLIATTPEALHKKVNEWHAKLATALIKLSTDSNLKPLLQDLAVIPLNDGTWTASRDQTIFFAKGDASLQIPDGIQVLIVDAAAESDPARRTLFTSLGVKTWETPEICRLILKVHSSVTFKPEQLTATQIISHAVFLYEAAWQPPKGADLYFATATDKRCRGREMYISGSGNADSASGRVFAQLEKRFPVMHGGYLSALAGEAGWPDWLVQNLGLSRIPRLITPVVEPRPQPTEIPTVHAVVKDPAEGKIFTSKKEWRKHVAEQMAQEIENPTRATTSDSERHIFEEASDDPDDVPNELIEDLKPQEKKDIVDYPDDMWDVGVRMKGKGKKHKRATTTYRNTSSDDLPPVSPPFNSDMKDASEAKSLAGVGDGWRINNDWGFTTGKSTDGKSAASKGFDFDFDGLHDKESSVDKTSAKDQSTIDDAWANWGTTSKRDKKKEVAFSWNEDDKKSDNRQPEQKPRICLNCEDRSLECEGNNPCYNCIRYSVRCEYITSPVGGDVQDVPLPSIHKPTDQLDHDISWGSWGISKRGKKKKTIALTCLACVDNCLSCGGETPCCQNCVNRGQRCDYCTTSTGSDAKKVQPNPVTQSTDQPDDDDLWGTFKPSSRKKKEKKTRKSMVKEVVGGNYETVAQVPEEPWVPSTWENLFSSSSDRNRAQAAHTPSGATNGSDQNPPPPPPPPRPSDRPLTFGFYGPPKGSDQKPPRRRAPTITIDTSTGAEQKSPRLSMSKEVEVEAIPMSQTLDEDHSWDMFAKYAPKFQGKAETTPSGDITSSPDSSSGYESDAIRKRDVRKYRRERRDEIEKEKEKSRVNNERDKTRVEKEEHGSFKFYLSDTSSEDDNTGEHRATAANRQRRIERRAERLERQYINRDADWEQESIYYPRQSPPNDDDVIVIEEEPRPRSDEHRNDNADIAGARERLKQRQKERERHQAAFAVVMGEAGQEHADSIGVKWKLERQEEPSDERERTGSDKEKEGAPDNTESVSDISSPSDTSSRFPGYSEEDNGRELREEAEKRREHLKRRATRAGNHAREGTTQDSEVVQDDERIEVIWEDSSELSEDEPIELLFRLSEEFVFMFHECESSDVLQLLRENWHHYSQWIEGTHMKWQTEEYVTSSMQLKNKIGTSIVRTIRGSLPLGEAVLAKLDTQLDQGKTIPVLEIQEPEHPEWNLLSYFGVLMKADVDYYLRCLIAISRDEKPDIDTASYIYEQIQLKYTGNEELIRAAFYNSDIVLVPPDSHSSTDQGHWTRMEDCVSKEIDIESKYSSCSYLFRCLVSPSGDPIGGLVHTMTLINSCSKLEDIARLFREVSKLLKDVNTSKAALLLKPLQSKSIFPIFNGAKKPEYDTLLDMHDKSWFIADEANLVESFTGVVPLLALSIQDLPAVEDLFRVLRVEGRKMSKMVTSQTLAMGQTRADPRHTDAFRSKAPFIKALIPRNHPSEATVRRQVTELRVRIATAVSQTFTMTLPDKEEIHGNSIPGLVSISTNDDSFTLIMTEETATAECPSHQLVSLLAETCGIKDQKHISLLFTALSNMSLKNINAAFLQQGVKVEGLLLDEPKTGNNFLNAIHRIDGMRMPSPFNEKMMQAMTGGGTLPEGLNFGPRHGPGGAKSTYDPNYQDPDRRLPMLHRINGAGTTYSNIPLSELIPRQKEFDGWDNMQYLGENMVARLLQIHLGSSFDPTRDWTSEMRERAGYSYFAEDPSFSSFTLAKPETIERMTDFVTLYGISQSQGWQKRLEKHRPKYHIDVMVSAGGKLGRFVMQARWIERMADLKMPEDVDADIRDVHVLVRVIKAYSEADFKLEILVNPWYIVQDGMLSFKKNWLLTASLNEGGDQWWRRNSTSSSERDWMSLDGDYMSPSDEDEMGHQNDGNESSPKEHAALLDDQKQLVTYNGCNHPETEEYTERCVSNVIYLPWTQSSNTAVLQGHDAALHTTGRRELYTYRALLPGYMRLLYLLPGPNDDPLQAVLNHIHYNHAGTYHALSYVWGTDERTEELITPDGIISITASLHAAFQALRQTSQAIMIWADAVCINQSDTQEKAQQIRLMPQIFQACECTYAFLSEGNPDVDRALEMLMQVRSRAVLDERKRTKEDDPYDECEWPAGLPRIPYSWRENRIPPLHSTIWKSVKTLFALPYFRRSWIVQEVVAAPNVKVVCGRWLIEWEDLYAGLEAVDREVQIAEYEEGISELRASWEPFLHLAAQREWEARHFRWSLLMLLEHFRYAESTLARDRLFALVGLASDGNEADFEPDYKAPIQDVVLNFAKAFVKQGRGMQLLYRAGLPASKQDTRFPSWIPDWTAPRPVGLHDSSDTDLSFSACGPQPASLSLGPAPDELSVDGREMDTIISLTTASNTESEWATYFAEIDALIDGAVLSSTMGPREDLKWKVPIASAPFPRAAGSGSTDMKKSYAAFRKAIAPSLSTCVQHFAKDTQKSYMACLRGTLAGWKFAVTKRGYVGVVPGMSSVGDVVATMKGGCVPFVVRGSAEREGRWRMVGECYVHGVMKGEGLWLPGVEERTFCLH